MLKNLITTLTFILFLLVSGCKSMETLQKSVTKSDSGTNSNTSITTEHGDYLNDATPTYSVSGTNTSTETPIVSSSLRNNAPDSVNNGYVYKKDYSSLVGSGVATSASIPLTRDEMTLRDYNQNLVDQYRNMDQLGEVVLFEIGVIDKAWQLTANRFKTANPNERDLIARELSKLDDDKLLLYKAYTKIYKSGKSDWVKVKNEVEDTLLNIRGVK